jgi:hypothetical protein
MQLRKVSKVTDDNNEVPTSNGHRNECFECRKSANQKQYICVSLVSIFLLLYYSISTSNDHSLLFLCKKQNVADRWCKFCSAAWLKSILYKKLAWCRRGAIRCHKITAIRFGFDSFSDMRTAENTNERISHVAPQNLQLHVLSYAE